MKSEFKKPWLEIFELDTADIITDSPAEGSSIDTGSGEQTNSGFAPIQ